MSEEKFVTVELGYKGTDFTRKYKIGGVSDAALATLKEKILAYNANLPAVDKAVFVADDGESPLTGITAAQYTYVAAQDISLDSVPIIYDILMTPETLNVMQQQFTTATVTAVTNEFVSDLTFELQDAPAWVSMVENVIRVQPTDNELGATIITVVAKDTGSNEQTAAQFTVNVRARPIINSAAVTPATVNAIQGTTETATITAVANEAVQSLTYELEDAPAWITNDEDIILISPTENDLGTVTVTAIVKDADSSARAATDFVAEARLRPIISSVAVNPSNLTVQQGNTASATITATANAAVTSLAYELQNAPSWITIDGNIITFAPTTADTESATVNAVVRDTGSTVQASVQLVADIKIKPRAQLSVSPNTVRVFLNSSVTATIDVDSDETLPELTYQLSVPNVDTTGAGLKKSIANNIITMWQGIYDKNECRSATLTAYDPNNVEVASTVFTVMLASKYLTIDKVDFYARQYIKNNISAEKYGYNNATIRGFVQGHNPATLEVSHSANVSMIALCMPSLRGGAYQGLNGANVTLVAAQGAIPRNTKTSFVSIPAEVGTTKTTIPVTMLCNGPASYTGTGTIRAQSETGSTLQTSYEIVHTGYNKPGQVVFSSTSSDEQVTLYGSGENASLENTLITLSSASLHASVANVAYSLDFPEGETAGSALQIIERTPFDPNYNNKIGVFEIVGRLPAGSVTSLVAGNAANHKPLSEITPNVYKQIIWR